MIVPPRLAERSVLTISRAYWKTGRDSAVAPVAQLAHENPYFALLTAASALEYSAIVAGDFGCETLISAPFMTA